MSGGVDRCTCPRCLDRRCYKIWENRPFESVQYYCLNCGLRIEYEAYLDDNIVALRESFGVKDLGYKERKINKKQAAAFDKEYM